MVTCRIKLFTLILVVFSGLFAQLDEAEDLKQILLDNYSNINTFEAEFQQHNYWHDLDTELFSKGDIYFNNTHLKLAYRDPVGQFLILDSLQVTIYDPASNQALISSSSEIDIRPRSIIHKYWQDSLIVSIKQEANKADVSLRTEAGDQINFHTEDEIITELSYTDADSNRVTYRFSEIKLNEELPDGIFTVKLPEDVNLLDTRQ